jgi:hypothetical protein
MSRFDKTGRTQQRLGGSNSARWNCPQGNDSLAETQPVRMYEEGSLLLRFVHACGQRGKP